MRVLDFFPRALVEAWFRRSRGPESRWARQGTFSCRQDGGVGVGLYIAVSKCQMRLHPSAPREENPTFTHCLPYLPLETSPVPLTFRATRDQGSGGSQCTQRRTEKPVSCRAR